jgi:hypothetical protein
MAVKPFPALQIINLILGLIGFAWEWPLKFVAGTTLHRSIVARLAIYPLNVLAALLLYQGTNAGLYYLIGLGVYFWAYSEGEVRQPAFSPITLECNREFEISVLTRIARCRWYVRHHGSSQRGPEGLDSLGKYSHFYLTTVHGSAFWLFFFFFFVFWEFVQTKASFAFSPRIGGGCIVVNAYFRVGTHYGFRAHRNTYIAD